MTLTQIKPAGLSKPVDLADNEKIRLGTGNDLELYHSGTQSYVTDQGTGNLNLQGTSKVVIGNAAHNENMAQFFADGAVELYYDNVKKLDTQATSVRLFDDLVMSANNILLNDNAQIQIGNAPDLRIYHDGSHSFITNTTGDLTLVDESRIKLRTDQFVLNNHANDESIIYAAADGEVSLYHNGTKRFDTTSTGVNIFGSDTTGSNLNGDLVINNAAGTRYAVFDASHTKLNFSDNAEATFGDSHDLRLYHNGSNSYLKQGATGDLYIDAANGASADIRMRAQAHIYAQVNGNEEAFQAFANGAVELYYDSVKKIETTSTGIKVDSTSDAIIDLHHNNSTAHCRLNFSNNNGDAHGGVWYSASSNMEFRTSNNERLRITSSGQIWKRQDPVNRTALKTYTGGEGLMFDHYQLQDSGTYIRYSDIVSIGDGSQGSAMRLLTMPNSGTPQERLRIHPTGEVTIPAGVTLGTAIGSNTSSNTLDDYEEGTWTPVPTLTYNPGGRSITAASGNEGIYVKIGRFVHVEYKVGWTAISGSGYFNVGASGLPYAADGTVHVVSGTARSNQTGYTFVAEGLQNSQINVFRRYDNGGPNENDVMYGFATYQTS